MSGGLPGEAGFPRTAGRRDSAEVRAKVSDELHLAIGREAAARGVGRAECIRLILEEHFSGAISCRGESLEDIATAVTRQEELTTLVASMIDQMVLALLLRSPALREGELEMRLAAASEGHRKWEAGVRRLLEEGGPHLVAGGEEP